jgi:predicted aldo/keto reductase-like oxidoreductase
MIRRKQFGSTGHNSSVTIFGAASLGRVSQKEADETLKILIKYGVNHIDTAASYGDSELRIGPWMKKHRKDFFLATKTGNRTYEGAKKEIKKSLERLRVESVDLLQLHNLVHPDDWDKAMGSKGALKAAIEAKDKELTKFIGVTGHGLMSAAMHKRSLSKYDFDSVLLPWNFVLYKETRYRNDFNSLLEICKDRGIAVQTIKSITRGPWGLQKRRNRTWYEPLIDQADIDKTVSWILGQDNIFLNTVGDIHVLPKVLLAASKHQNRPTNEEMEELVEIKQMSRLFVS